MAKWEVQCRVDTCITVEADTVEEALKKADASPRDAWGIDFEENYRATNLDTGREYELEDGELYEDDDDDDENWRAENPDTEDAE